MYCPTPAPNSRICRRLIGRNGRRNGFLLHPRTLLSGWTVGQRTSGSSTRRHSPRLHRGSKLEAHGGRDLATKLNLHDCPGLIRPQRSGVEPVTCDSFVWRDATKAFAQRTRPLRSIGGPHLQETIGKSRLENSASDRRERHLIS